jgi:RNA polymerase sigma factor (sigma-70 family)
MAASDKQLLEEYVRKGSQEAFAAIVERHTREVYAACYRMLGNPHAAEDATQAVFLALMQKAGHFSPDVVLPCWLHRAARFAARHIRRTEERRARHEKEAATMNPALVEIEEERWRDVRPVLDEALDSLPEAQRKVVTLRYLCGKSDKEVCRELKWNQSRSSMTVHRGLDNLRKHLVRRGVAVSGAMLIGFLAQASAEAAPASVVASTQAACIGGGTVSALAVKSGILQSFLWIKIKIAALVTAGAMVGTAVVTTVVLAIPAQPKSAQTVSAGSSWYVAPNGKTGNAGTQDSPWAPHLALAGETRQVQPGDTIYFMEGTYPASRAKGSRPMEIRLAGTQDKPIVIRNAPGKRVLIDGAINFMAPASHVWLRDIELTGGDGTSCVNLAEGSYCKAVNLVVHDSTGGIGSEQESTGAEIYGCVIYRTGKNSSVMIQNNEGVKTVSNCIMNRETSGQMSLHAFCSRAGHADNLLITENIAYGQGDFLAGGERPARNIRLLKNYLYGQQMLVGYYASPSNEDCEVRDNIIANGSLEIHKNFKRVINEGNLALASGANRPSGAKTVLLPNKYDPSRAHLAVYNWDKKSVVEVPFAPFMKAGESFRLMDPQDIYGRAVFRDKVGNGGKAEVPVPGEFGVFVVIKEVPASAGDNR